MPDGDLEYGKIVGRRVLDRDVANVGRQVDLGRLLGVQSRKCGKFKRRVCELGTS